MKKPYIGITGFMTPYEVLKILKNVPASFNRLIMIGVLSNFDILSGLENTRYNRYPKLKNIADIFIENPRVFNVIHYHTKDSNTLLKQLLEMTKFGGSNLHGFQLNITWPSPAVLKEYRSKYPDKQIVLQIGQDAFDIIEHSSKQLTKKITKEYIGLVDYILLDTSQGRGQLLKTKVAHGYLSALNDENMDIALGVAGGLSPSTLVDIIEPLVEEFPDISIDAESRLRDENNSLDIGLAKAYIKTAMSLFKNI